MSLEIKDLSFSYGDRRILKNISLSVPDGCLLSVLGPNGVGKSTLFRCILGLLHSYTGSCLINGGNTLDMSAKQRAMLIAYIPQTHYPAFNYSVLDMVLMGTAHRVSGVSSPGSECVAQAHAALERLGIAHLRDRGYMQISGGEQQLTLIARALVQQASVLIMDEPTANLDYGNRTLVLSEIKSLTNDGYTVIQSTHDPEQAYIYSDLIAALKDGRILRCGAPSDVFDASLIRELYGVEAEVLSLNDDHVRVCIPK